jgi:hypothetical protein
MNQASIIIFKYLQHPETFQKHRARIGNTCYTSTDIVIEEISLANGQRRIPHCTIKRAIPQNIASRNP